MIGLRGIPAKSGGIEVVIEHLAPLLVKLGIEVTVYCRNPYCKEKPTSFKGVKLRYLPTINTKYTEALSHSFLATFDALFRDYDIIHYHAMGNALFSIIPRLVNKKTIITLHGLDWQREKWGWIATLYLKMCERMITFFPNKVISVSNKVKKYYAQKYNKKIDYIPNGVNPGQSRLLSYLKKYDMEKEKYILFLSRIVPEKGLHFLIEAFKTIKTDYKLVIVGDATHTDSYYNKIKNMAKSDNRIILTGALYNQDKIEAYSNAAFFVLPSTIEGMPMVLLEAMSFGLCPLVSDIEENKEVIEDGRYGFSFRSKDTKDLKTQLKYLIKSPEKRKEIGDLSKSLIKRKYNWEMVAKRTFKLYKNGKKL